MHTDGSTKETPATIPPMVRCESQPVQRVYGCLVWQVCCLHYSLLGDPATSSLKGALKLESKTELEAARGLRTCGLSEEGGAERSKIVLKVDMVQEIERIHRECDHRAFVLG